VLDMRDMCQTSSWIRCLPLRAHLPGSSLGRFSGKLVPPALEPLPSPDNRVLRGVGPGARRAEAFRIGQSLPMATRSSPPPPEAIAKAEAYWNNFGITRVGDDFVACFFGLWGGNWTGNSDRCCPPAPARREGIPFRVVRDGRQAGLFQEDGFGRQDGFFPGWVGAAEIHVLMRRASVGLDPLPDRYDFLEPSTIRPSNT